MTTRMQLRVQRTLIDAQALSGAIADVIPVAGRDGAESYRGLVIPVSSHDSEEIEVAPGRYLVRAYLPSGSLLSTQVTARPDETTSVVLESEETPHEWLGWQGLVKQRAPARMTRALPAGGAPNVLLAQAPGAPWRELHQLTREGSVVSAQAVSAALGATPAALGVRTHGDDRTASFVVESAGAALGQRYFAIVERGTTATLVSLPVPWARHDRRGELGRSSVDIAVPLDADEDLGVVVQDPELGAVLGFLASGGLPSAMTMSEAGTPANQQLLSALYGKVENPYAAAVGAYLLLQRDSDAKAHWHPWVENLARWFRWLPDGAALLGAMRLRMATSHAELARARDAFEEAIARGVPVLAPVLRLLLEGVSTLVGDPDADAGTLEESLPLLQSVAGAMATNQALTTLTFRERP